MFTERSKRILFLRETEPRPIGKQILSVDYDYLQSSLELPLVITSAKINYPLSQEELPVLMTGCIRWLKDPFHFIDLKVNELYLYPLQNFQKIYWFYKVCILNNKKWNSCPSYKTPKKSEGIWVINVNNVNKCSVIKINVLV